MEVDIYEYNDELQGIKVLGSDTILYILYHLPVTSIISFSLTCHRFYDVVNSDSLWSKVCRREFGDAVVDAWPSSRRRRFTWKQLYGEMLFCGAVAWHHLNQWDMIPPGRASLSMNIVSGKLVVFGGGCEGGRGLGDTWVANLPNNLLGGLRWQRACITSPPARFGHSCVVVEGTLLLFGGINDSGTRQLDTWTNASLLHTSSSADDISSWHPLLVSHSPPARGAHASCYAGDNQVVVFGGIRSDGVRTNDTWILDLSFDPPGWRELQTRVSPPPRSGHSLTYMGNRRIILFGGRGAQFEVLNDVWMLSLEGEGCGPSWTELRSGELTESPSPRAGHSASLVFGGRVLVYGGEDSRRSKKGDVWLLDPGAGVRSETSGGGGVSTSRETCMRKFWKKLKVRGQSPSRRSFHGACSLGTGHGVLVFGGMVDDAFSTGLVFNSELCLLQLIP